MTATNAITKIRVLLGVEEEVVAIAMASEKLVDGTEVKVEGELEAGKALVVVTVEGDIPAPAGKHMTESNKLITVDEAGVITQIEEEINRHDSVEILVAGDGLQLVEEQAIRRTSVILLDADLLQDRLLRLITILRTVDSHCKIVLFLSSENLPLCEKTLPLGMVWYFYKPVPVANTANLICSFLNILTGAPTNDS